MRADTPPDDGIFATLDRQHVEAALAAERVTSARWRQGSAGRERGAKWKQQAALIALVDALERERRLAAKNCAPSSSLVSSCSRLCLAGERQFRRSADRWQNVPVHLVVPTNSRRPAVLCLTAEGEGQD
jgi:hypothetical protein